MTRNKLIQRIHVFKRDLSLDDETYRTVLNSVAGKSSCTELQDEELNLVKVALERMVERRQPGTSTIRKNPRQHAQIARLMDHLGWTWKATANFCLHQTGKPNTQACSAAELSKIIIGMIRIVDADIKRGKLKLSPEELNEYHRYTRLHRTPEHQHQKQGGMS